MPETAAEERSWLDTFKRRRREGVTDTAELKQRAIENHKFATPGEEQVPYERNSEGGLRGRRRRKFAMMSVNEIHPILSTMAGRQVMGRFERRYIARSSRADVRRWAEPLSNWDRAVVDACHAAQEESQAFRNGPGIAGLSWLRVSVDYLEDPEGMIVEEEVPLWNMLWPAKEARKKNLLDRDWHIYGHWMSLDRFEATWPEKVEEVKSGVGKSPAWEPSGEKQGVSSRVPWEGLGGSSEGVMSFFDPKERMLWVEHYERREPQSRYFVIVPPDGLPYEEAVDEAGAPVGTVEEMTPEEFGAYEKGRTEALGEPEVPRDRYIRKAKMIYLYSWHVGDVVVEEGEIEIGRFTYEAITGYPFVQPERVDWRSVTDALRTPQIWINIFLTMLAKYMQVNPKGVLFAERGVFKNRSEGLAQFSSTGGFVEVERGKLSGSPNPPFKFETGGRSPMEGFVQSMLGYAQDLLPRSAGFNPGALGQLGPDLRRISGTVVEHVRDAAVASQGELYDSYSLCRQRIGLIFLALLGKVLKVDHLRRVVGDEPFQEAVIGPDGQPMMDPMTGEPMTQEVEPPDDVFGDAIWSVSVEETKPAPDRMRFFWESLTESGALQSMLQPGADGSPPALTPEDIIELAPDLPEEFRKRKKEQFKLARIQMQQMQAQAPLPPEGGEEAPVAA